MSRYGENLGEDVEIDVGSLLLVLWRRKGWVIFWTLVGLALAAAFLLLVDPVYRTDARILIERRETVFTRPNDEKNVSVSPDFDVLTLASQVEVLRSRSILKPVAEKLKLAQVAEFDPLLEAEAGSRNPIAGILALIGFQNNNVNDTREGRVLGALSDKLAVYSVGDSRVVAVQVTSKDPVLAAEIANAISDEYILTQRVDDGIRAKGASQFLESEIENLRARVDQSERAVEEFRASADLIAVDSESTLTKQQLSETLTLMSEVSAQRAAAEAKSDQIRRLISSGAALDSSSDVQGSPLIQRLREQQVALKARIVDLQTSLLPNHPQVQAARSQLKDLEEEIARQALLIARALEGDAQIAKARQQELEQQVARLKTATARANQQEIKLRALERDARSQRELLETYLMRFRESTARQNSELLPVNARVISKANAPVKRHFPKVGPTLSVAGFAGGFLSCLFILLGELMSGRALRGRDMVQEQRQPADPKMAETAVSRSAAALKRIQDFEQKKAATSQEPPIEEAPLIAPLTDRAAQRRKVAPQIVVRKERIAASTDAAIVESDEPFEPRDRDDIETRAQHHVEIVDEPVDAPEIAENFDNDPVRDIASTVMVDPDANMAGEEVREADGLGSQSEMEGTTSEISEIEAIMASDQGDGTVPEVGKLPAGLQERGEEPALGARDGRASTVPIEALVRKVAPQDEALNRKQPSVTRERERLIDTDLYTMEDALAAIEQYQLQQIVVLPVFQNFSCADLALQLARAVGASGTRTVFVDITSIEFGDEVALAGIADVMAGKAVLEDVIFADPMSSVDLIASGTLQLEAEDWDEGHMQGVLDRISEDYDIVILDAGEGTIAPYLEELIERCDMMLFAVGVPISRRQVADILSARIGEVPAHSMFVHFDDEDVESAA